MPFKAVNSSCNLEYAFVTFYQSFGKSCLWQIVPLKRGACYWWPLADMRTRSVSHLKLHSFSLAWQISQGPFELRPSLHNAPRLPRDATIFSPVQGGVIPGECGPVCFSTERRPLWFPAPLGGSGGEGFRRRLCAGRHRGVLRLAAQGEVVAGNAGFAAAGGASQQQGGLRSSGGGFAAAGGASQQQGGASQQQGGLCSSRGGLRSSRGPRARLSATPRAVGTRGLAWRQYIPNLEKVVRLRKG